MSRCVGQLIGFADISNLSTPRSLCHLICSSIILVLVNCVLPACDSNCPQQRPGEPGNLGVDDLGLLSRLHLWVIHCCACTLPTWLPRAETVCSVYFTDLAGPRPCSVLTGQAPCQQSTEGSKEPSRSYVCTAMSALGVSHSCITECIKLYSLTISLTIF